MKKLSEKVREVPDYLKNWVLTFKGGLTLFCLAILFLIPIFTQNEYYLEIFVLAMIFTIFAASWDFLAGFTGQVSFGHAIFFGLSAYTVGFLLVSLNFSWEISLLFGILISVIIGFLVGAVCLRLKGPYLAVGTLIISLMLLNLFKIGPIKDYLEARHIYGWGDEGISSVPALSPDSVLVYYALLLFMIFSLIILIQISKSNMGTILKSIRDDETGAEASGINTTKYKVIGFVISAAFAGLAGGLFVMFNRSVNPLIYQPYYSFVVIVMAALGGIATISGSALGAFTFIFLAEILRIVETTSPANPIIEAISNSSFIFSIMLIIIIRFVSEGILKSALEKLKDMWDILLGR
ncbi:MAG: branched-chain amino acid ABC transporter permease [Promethearchaeota archaeon]